MKVLLSCSVEEDAAARCSETSLYIYQTTWSQKMLEASRERCKHVVLNNRDVLDICKVKRV